ncbi:MAG: bifunctional DNA-formamidopyrimidine glycosylase/DNA-(apurinic or apyrimidinic site) lyase [Actinobacteria bacterium]|nr:bifunctional DNA-formamidopyrimidine glycosylase/DNA-(apurinic or apyrimidinic site) lyase [Actinomycetota bacterium]
MPELPEVESVRRQLDPELTGRRVVSVWWDPHPEQRFSDVALLEGRRILAVTRRGKYLVCPLDEDLELVLHLGMTGSFSFRPADAYARARFALDDGRELVFRDPRRFGRVSVVEAGEYDAIPTLAALGPEPLSDDFDPATFAEALRRSKTTVKAALLGQRLVAGVGNIYADEALWRTRIHPTSRRVGHDRATALHAAIRDVLRESIEREGTTFRDYQMVNGESGRNADFLSAYGQEGRPCARCGTAMRKTVVAQRGTTYCPSCQRV